MKNVTILLAVVAMLAVPAVAHEWDGGGGNMNWHTANNWDPNTVPSGPNDYAAIGAAATGTVLITTGNTANPGSIRMGFWTGSADMELQAGGAIAPNYWFAIGYGNGFSDSNFSTFAQTGGTVLGGETGVFVGTDDGGSTIGRGRYTISGGSLGTATASSHLIIGRHPTTHNNIGQFIVDCSGAAGSGPDLIRVSSYAQNSVSKVEFKLDANGNARQIDLVHDVDLAGTLTLTGTRTSTDPLVLMTYTGTLSTVFDTEPTGWTIDYGTGSNSQVTATIPEPATMCLLGIGGIGVLIRRKRR